MCRNTEGQQYRKLFSLIFILKLAYRNDEYDLCAIHSCFLVLVNYAGGLTKLIAFNIGMRL